MSFNLTTYMKEVAERLKDLTASGPRPNFHRATSVNNLEEFLQSQPSVADTCLIVMDNRTGKLNNVSGSENIWDDKFNSFFIVKHVELNNFDDRQDKLDACETILFKIISRMNKHKREDHQGNNERGLADLDMGSFGYDTIGPIGDGFHGLMVHFTMLDPAMKKLVYDVDDWNE